MLAAPIRPAGRGFAERASDPVRQLAEGSPLCRWSVFSTGQQANQPSVKVASNAMPAGDSKEWFGNPPPDLTLVARVRGTDWLYTYLRTFYVDESRPFGVNNTTFPNVGMPHALWELQGWQKKVEHVEVDDHGHEHKVVELELEEQGAKTPEEYDQVVRDIVTFLAYLGEPIQQERKTLGVWVLLFLFVLFVVSYYLKKEYWKDIH